MTAPLHVTGRVLREPDAVRIYSEATVLDGFDGTYPPDDNGSSGLAACKAAKNEGLIGSYRWAFGLDEALAALVLSPVMVGVGWYDGFDAPNPEGLVHVSGSIRGGHEFTLIGLDVKAETVFAVNSWGTGWGLHGRFCFSFADLSRLLTEDGDAVVPAA